MQHEAMARRLEWHAKALAAVLLIACLPACDKAAKQPAPRPDSAAKGDDRSGDVRIAFVDFYKQPTILLIDGRTFYRGVLDVPKKEESTGLSLLTHARLRGRTTFRLISGSLDKTVVLDITPRTKVIYVFRAVPPYIKASDADAILLD